MNLDPDHWKFALFGIGIVTDENGQIRWNLVAGGIIVASTMACIGFVISMGTNLAAIEARQHIVLERLDRLESSVHPATSKRYTSDDAARDNDLLRTRIREAAEDYRRKDAEVLLRLQRIEDILSKRR